MLRSTLVTGARCLARLPSPLPNHSCHASLRLLSSSSPPTNFEPLKPRAGSPPPGPRPDPPDAPPSYSTQTAASINPEVAASEPPTVEVTQTTPQPTDETDSKVNRLLDLQDELRRLLSLSDGAARKVSAEILELTGEMFPRAQPHPALARAYNDRGFVLKTLAECVPEGGGGGYAKRAQERTQERERARGRERTNERRGSLPLSEPGSDENRSPRPLPLACPPASAAEGHVLSPPRSPSPP
jgi:hypothetical protein